MIGAAETVVPTKGFPLSALRNSNDEDLPAVPGAWSVAVQDLRKERGWPKADVDALRKSALKVAIIRGGKTKELHFIPAATMVATEAGEDFQQRRLAEQERAYAEAVRAHEAMRRARKALSDSWDADQAKWFGPSTN
jgi:hypothetical protein